MAWGPLSRLGIAVALLTALADQGLKLWLYFVFDLPARGIVNVAPFFDIVLIWNKGISYGLFQQDGPVGQWALLALTAVAIALLWIWLSHASSRLAALSLALIIGGAIGNAIDRLHWPGVMDFLLFYLTVGDTRYSWYVFNLADTAIVAGVAGLLYDSLARRPPQNSPDPDDNALGSGGGSSAQSAGSRGPT